MSLWGLGILIAALVIVGLIIRALLRRRHGRSPLASLGYTRLWELLGNKNIISLIIGVLLSGLLMVVAGVVVMWIFGAILPTNRPWFVSWLAFAIGAALTALPAYEFFQAGRFTVRPGESAFISFLNVPMGEMQVGDAWIIPKLMQYKLVSSQAFVVTGEVETFITGNGVNVQAQMSATVFVKDPLKFQGLQENPTNVQNLVKRQLSTKTRAFVAGVSPYVALRAGFLRGVSCLIR